MADITVTAAKLARVLPDSDIVKDFIAAEAITAGKPVYLTTAGKAGIADANAAGKQRVTGIALNAASAGQAVSVLTRGYLAGYTLTSQAYDAPIYLSDTVGALADTPGTLKVNVGRVSALSDKSLTKVLYVNCSATAVSPLISVSAEQTGTGSSQDVAHNLGVIPSQVFVSLTAGPGSYSQPAITEGSHTSTNVVVTVTLNWKFRVIAIA